MNTAAVVGGTVIHGEEDDEEKHLRLFKNNISADIIYNFLDYRRLSGNTHILQGSTTQLARLDVYVTIVLTCLEQREKRGRHREKLYADSFKIYGKRR